MAFADAFDMAVAIRNDLSKVLSQKLPIVMLTDSLSLFDVVTKATLTTEKTLLMDIKGFKDSYHFNEIENIGFIRSEYNPADTLTKVKPSSILEIILSSSQLMHLSNNGSNVIEMDKKIFCHLKLPEC